MITNAQPIERLLIWLLNTTRGGQTRAQIIQALQKNPKNTNQLAAQLKKSYKTISYHITVLQKHKLIIPIGDGYATTYFLSQPMEDNYSLFQGIVDQPCKGRKNRNIRKIAE